MELAEHESSPHDPRGSLMQPTTLGPNMTGASLTPAALAAMTQATDELTPFEEIDTSDMESLKRSFIDESDAVGSIPAPTTLKGIAKSGVPASKGKHPAVFLDKLGERLAYERSGARHYDALILKFEATMQAVDGEVLPPVRLEAEDGTARAAESAEQLLHRIRGEELEHFQMLKEAIISLGGDPTSMTPCADVTALASSGFMQVLNDPRTTLVQCLNATLAVELADNAGRELLASLADDMGSRRWPASSSARWRRSKSTPPSSSNGSPVWCGKTRSRKPSETEFHHDRQSLHRPYERDASLATKLHALTLNGTEFVPQAEEGEGSVACREQLNSDGSPSEVVSATCRWTAGTALARAPLRQAA
jgi:hypothetical protein